MCGLTGLAVTSISQNVCTKQPTGTVAMAQQVRTRALQARGPEFESAEPMSKARHGPATPVTPTLGRWGTETGGLPGLAGFQLSSRFSERSCPQGVRQSHSRTASVFL